MFNVNEVTAEMEQSAASLGLIPEGEHNFVIESARQSVNKKQDGEYIEITCILEGTNTKYWHYFNIKHINPRVVNIGKVELKNLMLAINMQSIASAEDLKDKVFRGQIEHQKQKDGKLQVKITVFGPYLWSGNVGTEAGKKAEFSDDDVPF
jgi:hypothetical protein